jgi:hypothetical protein
MHIEKIFSMAMHIHITLHVKNMRKISIIYCFIFKLGHPCLFFYDIFFIVSIAYYFNVFIGLEQNSHLA